MMTPAERLNEVAAELAKGRIYEATLIDPTHHLEGLCNHETQVVVIDPKVSVIDSLIHELVHRRWPAWSEARVRRETRALMGQLSTADVEVWYRRYRRAVKKRRPVSSV
jgi:hypothetical protein